MFDFIIAAKEDDVETLLRILQSKNISMDKSDWVHNETALTISTKYGRQKSVEFLLSNGANANRANRQGKTPLYYAINGNHIGCLERILASKDIETNVAVHEGLTPLMLSAKLAFDVCVKLLIDNGCDLDMKSGSEKKGAIHYCIQPDPWQAALIQTKTMNDDSHDSRFQCLKSLVESGADVNLPDGNGMTALHYAIRNRNVKAVELLVLEGCSVNAPARWENAKSCCIGPVTPALLAAYVSNTRIISVLLAAGCNFLQCPAMLKIKSNHRQLLCRQQRHHMPRMIGSNVLPIKLNPKNLKSVCRLAIRKAMGQNIIKSSDQLRLPKPIKAYVCKIECEN